MQCQSSSIRTGAVTRTEAMKIISPSRRDVAVAYTLEFGRVGGFGSGFAFECDEHGKVDTEKLNPAARANYEACLAGTNDTVPEGVVRREGSYRVPAVGECSCGAHVELAHFTNTCVCGRDYNGSGQELAPREQWGEETGEHWTDCY